MTELDFLRQENEAMRKALERISDPLTHMQREAEEKGRDLNVGVAIQMSESANFLKQIARDVLSVVSSGKL